MPHKVTPPHERFMKFVNKNGRIHDLHGQCWEWTGSKNKRGYGKFRNTTNQKDAAVYAHIYAFEYWLWKVKPGNVVCHKCDNPSCVNPNHLFEGNQTDNMRDAALKNRTRKGSLSEESISKILELSKRSIPQSRIADIFGVSQTHISNLINGKYSNYSTNKGTTK